MKPLHLLLPALFVLFTVTVVAVQTDAEDGLPRSFAGLTAGDSAVVREIVDGDTVVLDNGRQVRLVGIQAPKLPLGRPDFPVWPLAEEAKAALERLVLGQPVDLLHGPDARTGDRHDRVLAHLKTSTGQWIQGEMLAAGMARVYSFSDNRALVDEMLILERSARESGLGIWGHPFYEPRSPFGLAGDTGTFQLVEGTVVDAASVRGRGYLNFGDDWKTDFTVYLSRATVAQFERSGLVPEDYAGRRIRVRGWVDDYNGPEIEVTHPEQIELLTD